MNSRKSLYDIAEYYQKKAILNASYQGMRYRIWKASQATEGNEETRDCLLAAIWPEPYCYEKTKEEKRQEREFPYSEEGLDQVYEWLCESYEQDRDGWEHAKNHPGLG